MKYGRDYQAGIFYDFSQSLTQEKCSNRMKSMFSDEEPCKTAICNRFKEFSSGRKKLIYDIGED